MCPIRKLPANMDRNPCPKIQDITKALCQASAKRAPKGRQQRVVRATSGGAVLFYHTLSEGDEKGRLTARAIHGSCGVKKGVKVVLAKFVRSGAGPFKADEQEFSAALKRRR